MKIKSIRVSNIVEFDTQIKCAIEAGNPVLALFFFGTNEPETSDSWCSDCGIANSIVRKAIQVKKYILIEAAAGGRSEWKSNAANLYRVCYNVPAIPTLFK